MFDHWADPIVHLLQLKSFMGRLMLEQNPFFKCPQVVFRRRYNELNCKTSIGILIISLIT